MSRFTTWSDRSRRGRPHAQLRHLRARRLDRRVRGPSLAGFGIEIAGYRATFAMLAVIALMAGADRAAAQGPHSGACAARGGNREEARSISWRTPRCGEP